MKLRPVCYEYDGTFEGFLTCVFFSYADREDPVCFLSPEDGRTTLWPARRVDTQRDKAGRVFRSIRPKMGREAEELICRAFLTCLPDREVHLCRFLRYGYRRGAAAVHDLGDPRVHILWKAVRHLNEEAHLLTGFTRFSDFEGVLMGEIEPKNRVLPLLRRHFAGRYNTEQFLLFDRVHREALVHRPGSWAIVPVDELTLPPPGADELRYRQLWRRFYDTVAIEGRYNPKLRMTHMPKRYWNTMTEFQTDDGGRRKLPEGRD